MIVKSVTPKVSAQICITPPQYWEPVGLDEGISTEEQLLQTLVIHQALCDSLEPEDARREGRYSRRQLVKISTEMAKACTAKIVTAQNSKLLYLQTEQ